MAEVFVCLQKVLNLVPQATEYCYDAANELWCQVTYKVRKGIVSINDINKLNTTIDFSTYIYYQDIPDIAEWFCGTKSGQGYF